MKELKVRKNEIGTYLEILINDYNNFIRNPKFYGKEAYEYLRSLKIEIADWRKFASKEV